MRARTRGPCPHRVLPAAHRLVLSLDIFGGALWCAFARRGAGTWEMHPTKAETIYANFVGEKHAVTFDDCWSFVSVRDRDGDRATGTGRIEPPAKSCPELSTHS